MARGFVTEVWEGDGKFLQQMSRSAASTAPFSSDAHEQKG